MKQEDRDIMIDLLKKHGAATSKPTTCEVREAVEHVGKVIGTPVQTMTNNEAEECEYRVCSLERITVEDECSPCSGCAETLFHAPGGPFKPKKICIRCLLSIERGEESLSA